MNSGGFFPDRFFLLHDQYKIWVWRVGGQGFDSFTQRVAMFAIAYFVYIS